MKRTNLGEFEELVLLTVSILLEGAYGVAIKNEVEKQTGRKLSISAIHSVLHRLERKGFVASRVGGATAERGGRRKRFFKLTGAGKAALVESRDLRERLWKLIPDFSFEGKV
ncbi:PadR family transcriptional regulator [bacterium]|nr:PadR family transcriptional regulator [bacterium]